MEHKRLANTLFILMPLLFLATPSYASMGDISVCFPFFLLLALLMAGMIAEGRSPLVGFDISITKPPAEIKSTSYKFKSFTSGGLSTVGGMRNKVGGGNVLTRGVGAAISKVTGGKYGNTMKERGALYAMTSKSKTMQKITKNVARVVGVVRVPVPTFKISKLGAIPLPSLGVRTVKLVSDSTVKTGIVGGGYQGAVQREAEIKKTELTSLRQQLGFLAAKTVSLAVAKKKLKSLEDREKNGEKLKAGDKAKMNRLRKQILAAEGIIALRKEGERLSQMKQKGGQLTADQDKRLKSITQMLGALEARSAPKAKKAEMIKLIAAMRKADKEKRVFEGTEVRLDEMRKRLDDVGSTQARIKAMAAMPAAIAGGTYLGLKYAAGSAAKPVQKKRLENELKKRGIDPNKQFTVKDRADLDKLKKAGKKGMLTNEQKEKLEKLELQARYARLKERGFLARLFNPQKYSKKELLKLNLKGWAGTTTYGFASSAMQNIPVHLIRTRWSIYRNKTRLDPRLRTGKDRMGYINNLYEELKNPHLSPYDKRRKINSILNEEKYMVKEMRSGGLVRLRDSRLFRKAALFGDSKELSSLNRQIQSQNKELEKLIKSGAAQTAIDAKVGEIKKIMDKRNLLMFGLQLGKNAPANAIKANNNEIDKLNSQILKIRRSGDTTHEGEIKGWTKDIKKLEAENKALLSNAGKLGGDISILDSKISNKRNELAKLYKDNAKNGGLPYDEVLYGKERQLLKEINEYKSDRNKLLFGAAGIGHEVETVRAREDKKGDRINEINRVIDTLDRKRDNLKRSITKMNDNIDELKKLRKNNKISEVEYDIRKSKYEQRVDKNKQELKKHNEEADKILREMDAGTLDALTRRWDVLTRRWKRNIDLKENPDLVRTSWTSVERMTKAYDDRIAASQVETSDDKKRWKYTPEALAMRSLNFGLAQFNKTQYMRQVGEMWEFTISPTLQMMHDEDYKARQLRKLLGEQEELKSRKGKLKGWFYSKFDPIAKMDKLEGEKKQLEGQLKNLAAGTPERGRVEKLIKDKDTEINATQLFIANETQTTNGKFKRWLGKDEDLVTRRERLQKEIDILNKANVKGDDKIKVDRRIAIKQRELQDTNAHIAAARAQLAQVDRNMNKMLDSFIIEDALYAHTKLTQATEKTDMIGKDIEADRKDISKKMDDMRSLENQNLTGSRRYQKLADEVRELHVSVTKKETEKKKLEDSNKEEREKWQRTWEQARKDTEVRISGEDLLKQRDKIRSEYLLASSNPTREPNLAAMDIIKNSGAQHAANVTRVDTSLGLIENEIKSVSDMWDKEIRKMDVRLQDLQGKRAEALARADDVEAGNLSKEIENLSNKRGNGIANKNTELRRLEGERDNIWVEYYTKHPDEYKDDLKGAYSKLREKWNNLETVSAAEHTLKKMDEAGRSLGGVETGWHREQIELDHVGESKKFKEEVLGKDKERAKEHQANKQNVENMRYFAQLEYGGIIAPAEAARLDKKAKEIEDLRRTTFKSAQADATELEYRIKLIRGGELADVASYANLTKKDVDKIQELVKNNRFEEAKKLGMNDEIQRLVSRLNELEERKAVLDKTIKDYETKYTPDELKKFKEGEDKNYKKLQKAQKDFTREALERQAAELVAREQRAQTDRYSGIMAQDTEEKLRLLRKRFPENGRFWREVHKLIDNTNKDASEKIVTKYEQDLVTKRNEIKAVHSEISTILAKPAYLNNQPLSKEDSKKLKELRAEMADKQRELNELHTQWADFRDTYRAISEPRRDIEKFTSHGSEHEIKNYIKEYSERDVRNRFGVGALSRTEAIAEPASEAVENVSTFSVKHGSKLLLAATILAPIAGIAVPVVGVPLAAAMTFGSMGIYAGKSSLRKEAEWQGIGSPTSSGWDAIGHMAWHMQAWAQYLTGRGSGGPPRTLQGAIEAQVYGNEYLAKRWRIEEYAQLTTNQEVISASNEGWPIWMRLFSTPLQGFTAVGSNIAAKAWVRMYFTGGQAELVRTITENPRLVLEIDRRIQYQYYKMLLSLINRPDPKVVREMMDSKVILDNMPFYYPARDVITAREYAPDPLARLYPGQLRPKEASGGSRYSTIANAAWSKMQLKQYVDSQNVGYGRGR